MAKAVRQTAVPKTRPGPVSQSAPSRNHRPAPSGSPKPGFHGKSPLALVVYGPPGVGKTEFAANFPKVGFLHDPQEDGINDLVEFNSCPDPVFVRECKDWQATLDACYDVAGGGTGVETLVLDSLSGIEKLCFLHHCAEHFKGDWSKEGFFAYQQGPKNAAKRDWPDLIDALNECRSQGVNVVLIGHSQVKPFNNPDGPDYDRWIPSVDKETWNAIHTWAKAVLFYNYAVTLDKSGIKAKADTSKDERLIFSQWSAAFDAKNRYGLDPVIDAGDSGAEAFANFESAFKRAAGL